MSASRTTTRLRCRNPSCHSSSSLIIANDVHAIDSANQDVMDVSRNLNTEALRKDAISESQS